MSRYKYACPISGETGEKPRGFSLSLALTAVNSSIFRFFRTRDLAYVAHCFEDQSTMEVKDYNYKAAGTRAMQRRERSFEWHSSGRPCKNVSTTDHGDEMRSRGCSLNSAFPPAQRKKRRGVRRPLARRVLPCRQRALHEAKKSDILKLVTPGFPSAELYC